MKRVLGFLLAIGTITLSLGCVEPSPLPTPDVPVKARLGIVQGPSYARDIQPIFDESCVNCHGSQRAENGLRLDSYNHTIKGTQYGPVVVPSNSSFSTLVYVLDGETSPAIYMPYRDHPLSANRIENIKYWIDFGALDN